MIAKQGSKQLLVSMLTILALPFIFIGCANLGEALSDSDPYDFRKTRWGYPQERVLFTEQGKRIYLRGAHKSHYRTSVIRCVTFLSGLPQIELTNIAI